MMRISSNWLFAAALALAPAAPAIAAMPTAQGADGSLVASPALVREIQFMLLSLGFDPGPIDGNAQQLTNRAAHLFEQAHGLPQGDLVNNAPIPQAFLDRLRQDAAQVLLKNAPPAASQATAVPPAPAPAAPPAPAAEPVTAAVPPPAVTPAPAVPAPPPPAPTPAVIPAPAPAPPAPEPAVALVAPPPPPPPPPPVDRFAACAFDAADFRVGGQQFTPQSFIDQGFGGVTARAVSALSKRLDEARQIADKIGGPALVEVQRQARVLAYFECRQRIEQGAPSKN